MSAHTWPAHAVALCARQGQTLTDRGRSVSHSRRRIDDRRQQLLAPCCRVKLRNEEDEGNTVSHREGAASGTMGEQGPGKHAPPPKERPRSPTRRQATIRSQERCALNAHSHGDRAAKAQRGTSRGQQGVVGDPLKEPHANGRDGESWGYRAISISRVSSKRPVRGAAECEAARAATGQGAHR